MLVKYSDTIGVVCSYLIVLNVQCQIAWYSILLSL
jgi:hypothetical protein